MECREQQEEGWHQCKEMVTVDNTSEIGDIVGSSDSREHGMVERLER